MSWPAFNRGDYDEPVRRVRVFAEAGFSSVTLVPTWAYVGLDRIDLRTGPSFKEVRGALRAVRARGLSLVLKPHLDPLRYEPGFDPATTTSYSWRADCPWRGYFDVDPLSEAYLTGLLLPLLDEVGGVLRDEGGEGPPVRFELGAELMNSTVYRPASWGALLARMREELRVRGLEGRVLLSHNFSHHVFLPEDLVLRMRDPDRAEFADYIRGLDAVAVSQYMDLRAAMPPAERDARLPTAEEVAEALRAHERDLREHVFGELLGVDPARIPAFHIGEFGVGAGGLAHPNVWAETLPKDGAAALSAEVARGHEGFSLYLRETRGRTAQSGTLWVSGPGYDIHGWLRPEWRNDDAVRAYSTFASP